MNARVALFAVSGLESPTGDPPGLMLYLVERVVEVGEVEVVVGRGLVSESLRLLEEGSEGGHGRESGAERALVVVSGSSCSSG